MPHVNAFRPRARLLLQLGDQLIKNESIALLELVKNSYDADAKKVTVTLEKIDSCKNGKIIVEDDGFGMDKSIIETVWMEPGSNYKEVLFKLRKKTPLGRLPQGEKGIGRFGVHKLGREIELISKKDGTKEIYLKINWNVFEKADYLDDVEIDIIERAPEVFIGGKTGTRIIISDLRTEWTRGMLRDVYRSLMSLNSPFNSIDSFSVVIKTDKKSWIDDLLTFDKVKDYALFSASIEINDNTIKSLHYKFLPWDIMPQDIKPRENPRKNIRMTDESGSEIDIGNYKIGTIKIELLVFDRDANVLSLGIKDKKGLKEYLDENGGVRVYRDGIRVYDYGERENDWLNLGIRRINEPTGKLSNNIILGAVYIDRDKSSDLIEKTNREGFVENTAYNEFKRAVLCAIEKVETERKIDKNKIRNFIGGNKAQKEPVVSDIKELKEKVERKIDDESLKKEINSYLMRIELDYNNIKEIYLRSAGAGLSLSIVIHEIEKILKELNAIVQKETVSKKVVSLVKHLSTLTDGYASIIRSKDKGPEDLRKIIKQAVFNVEFRLNAHKIELFDSFSNYSLNPIIECSKSMIIGTIVNLIDNSIWWLNYGKIQDKKIYIGITDEIRGFKSIIVADNGPGFTLPTEDIIKPFISDKPGGIGLGLNIAYEVMSAHKGKLLFPDYSDIELPDNFKNGAIIMMAFKEELK